MVNTVPDPDLIALLEADREVLLRLAVRSVSHMLGTPLQVIGGHAALLGGIPGADKSAETIQRKTGETARQLQGLIDYARVTPDEAEVLDVAIVLESAVKALEATCADAHVQIDRPGISSQSIRACRGSFGHACLSLLLAAVRLAAPGGRVEVHLWEGTPDVPRRDAGFVSDGARMVVIDVDIHDRGQSAVEPRRHPWLDGDPEQRRVDLGLAVVAGLAREAGGWLGSKPNSQEPALRLAWPVTPE